MKHCNLTIILIFLLMGIISSFATPAFYAVNWSDASAEIRQSDIPVYGILGDQALISIEYDDTNRLKNNNNKMILLDKITSLNEYYLVEKRGKNQGDIVDQNINILLRSGDSYLVKGKTGLTEIYKQNFNILELGKQPMVLPPAEKLIAPVIKAENKSQPIVDLVTQVKADSVLSYLKYLQSMQTRFMFADNRRSVAEKIRAKYFELGCTTVEIDSFFIPGFYFQYFNANYPASWQYNVVATITGTEEPDNFILITGHHDSVVIPSVAGQDPYIFAPGIDDNGT